jgi:hypothetical protein
VPTEKRRRSYEEGWPALPRKCAAEGGEEGSVDRSVPDAATHLALEDPHLVTEHN